MKKFIPFILAICLTLPGLSLRIFSIHLDPIPTTIITALAIFSASFILTWCCEVMQIDIPQAVAVALIALIAVLPEYAVDIYFTWMAGKYPESDYVHYAIANMTGANRLLIGIGWSLIIFIFAVKFKKKLVLDKSNHTEIFFLMLATTYAFIVTIKGTLNLFDSAIFLSIFVWYVLIIIRKPVCDDCIEGVAEALAALPPKQRIPSVWGLFFFAAAVILSCAELFSEGLVASGKILGINEFLLVQWLAPIASEAPEFIIAVTFAVRGNGAVALGSLIASKLNQWTLLVGMIPLVYSISSGSTNHIPLETNQFHELLLTAAQSSFAISLIIGLVIGKREAFALFILFILQFLSPFYADSLTFIYGDNVRDKIILTFSIIYLVLATFFVIKHPKKFLAVFKGASFKVSN